MGKDIICKLCGKKLKNQDWVALIEFNLWGIMEGEINDCIKDEDYEVCSECMQDLGILLYAINENKKPLRDLIKECNKK